MKQNKSINEMLQSLLDYSPEAIRNNKDYEFYVGTGWENVPEFFKDKRVIVCFVIDPFDAYYCNSIL